MALTDSLQLRTGRWSPAVEIQLRETPDVTIKAGTEVLRQMGTTGYAATLLDVRPIRKDLDQRVISSTSVALRNGESGLQYDLAGLLNFYHAISCPLTVRLYFEGPDGTIENMVLFQGVVVNIEIDEKRVTFTADEYVKEHTLQVPAITVAPDSLNYGTREGEEPEGSRGKVVPIGYGYFNVRALSSTYTELLEVASWYGMPALLGIKTPMLPMTYIADLHQWENDGTTPNTDSKRQLFACGDLYNTNNTQIHIRPALTADDGTGGRAAYLPYSGLWTWNADLDQATAWLNDRSDYLTGAAYGSEYNTPSSGGNGSCVGAGWYSTYLTSTDQPHTTLTSRQQMVQTAWIQRTDPQWPKSGQSPPGYFTGRTSAVALVPESLDSIGGTTDSVTFGTTGVTNPENALKSRKLSEYALVAGTGRLSIKMLATGPDLGTVLCYRICVLVDGGSSASNDVRGAFRFHPDTGGLDGSPVPEIGCALLGTPDHQVKHLNDGTYDGLTDFFSWYVWAHNTTKQSQKIPQWEFLYKGTSPPQAYVGDVLLWSGDSSNSFRVHAIWAEAIYKDRLVGDGAAKPLVQDHGVYRRATADPNWLEDEVRSRGPYRGFIGNERYWRVWFRYSGNVANPASQPIGGPKVYAAGEGPAYHPSWVTPPPYSDRWRPGRTSGPTEASKPICNPASIALHAIDKYLNEYSTCEVADNTFGSFRDAMEYLETAAGGTFPDYRLTCWLKDRTSMRTFLDQLGEHSRSWIIKTRDVTGALKWRMFVDSYDPATDFPSNRWRSGAAIATGDIFRASVSLTPLTAIRNRFLLRYGFHEPTQMYAYERVLNDDVTDIASGGSTYVTACATSQTNYGGAMSSGGTYQMEEVLEFPWVWYDKVADDLLKYHCNLKRNRRVILKLTCNQNLLDVLVGQTIYVEDGLSNFIGSYPGLVTGTGWAAHQWHVVSKDVTFGRRGIQVEITLLERAVTP